MRMLLKSLPLFVFIACTDTDPVYPRGGGSGGTTGECEPYEPVLRWAYTYDDGQWVGAESMATNQDPTLVTLTWDESRLVTAQAVNDKTFLITIDRDADHQLARLETRYGGELNALVVVESRTDTEVHLRRKGLLAFEPLELSPGLGITNNILSPPLFKVSDYPALTEAEFDLELVFNAYVELNLDPLAIDLVAVRTYEEGILRRVTYDFDGDAQTDAQVDHLQDGEIKSTEYRVNGELRWVDTEIFEEGELVRTEHQSGGNTDVIRWQRDAYVIHMEHDRDNDMSIDRRTSIFYNSAGQRILKQEDERADGDIDWQKRYVYDANGRRTYEARDRNGNGWIDQRWDYKYDDQGRLISELLSKPHQGDCGAEW